MEHKDANEKRAAFAELGVELELMIPDSVVALSLSCAVSGSEIPLIGEGEIKRGEDEARRGPTRSEHLGDVVMRLQYARRRRQQQLFLPHP